MILSAIVMLLGGFALLDEPAPEALLLFEEPTCLRGFAVLDTELRVLKPTLNGADSDGPEVVRGAVVEFVADINGVSAV